MRFHAGGRGTLVVWPGELFHNSCHVIMIHLKAAMNPHFLRFDSNAIQNCATHLQDFALT